ncbi:MAG: FAD-dependent oxidoreductase [Planctomycetes bacterium]|nr:FAD-dependent oxidoreductase [Planctomycetota bacterium]
MNRRDFIRAGGLAALAPAAVRPQVEARCETVHEPARDVPVAETADVVVCGGGPAGVAAAISAARRGAKTLLLEQHGCLGGIWTAGLLAWLLDCDNKTGVMAEVIHRLNARGARTVTPGGQPTNAYDVEVMKVLLEELCEEAGVGVRYHTRAVAAVTSGGQLTHVLTESKSGREAVAGRAFVDATGDGDLGSQAGCGFDLGQPETGLTQPMSLICLVAGIRAPELTPFFNDLDSPQSWAAPKDALRAAMEAGGHSPSYAKPSLFRVRDDLFILMANHEYGVKGTSARDVTAATLRARKELHALIDGLRGTGGVWKDIRLVATAEQIGVREGRRLRGLYTVAADDLKQGRRFDDAVCRVTFGVDVHALDPEKNKGIDAHPWRAKPYDIPLRALVAKDVHGLLFAGRCISGDFIAHSSYRVTGNAAALGEAAGKAAAVAARTGKRPSEVTVAELG